MARTDVGAAINARLVPTTDYGADPRGLGFFRALAGRLQRGIAGTDAPPVVPGWAEFNGYAAPPQQFTGVAPLGVARPVVPSGSTLADERSAGALDNAALAIFAERLRRGR